jgi:hypothetical protein
VQKRNIENRKLISLSTILILCLFSRVFRYKVSCLLAVRSRKERERETKEKRFKIISSSRSTYTNIIYLHVVFEITMFIRIVLLWTVYFINLFMFMNIIPHIPKNLSKRRENEEQKRKETLKRCQGFRVRFEFFNIHSPPKALITERKRERRKQKKKPSG